jgi:hypothetical protein
MDCIYVARNSSSGCTAVCLVAAALRRPGSVSHPVLWLMTLSAAKFVPSGSCYIEVVDISCKLRMATKANTPRIPSGDVAFHSRGARHGWLEPRTKISNTDLIHIETQETRRRTVLGKRRYEPNSTTCYCCCRRCCCCWHVSNNCHCRCCCFRCCC